MRIFKCDFCSKVLPETCFSEEHCKMFTKSHAGQLGFYSYYNHKMKCTLCEFKNKIENDENYKKWGEEAEKWGIKERAL